MLVQDDSEQDVFKLAQSDQISRLMQEFECQGRVQSTTLTLNFCDSAPPANVCKTVTAALSVKSSSSGMLMLTNDGRIVSQLALLRSSCAPSAVNSLKKRSSTVPEWMRPPHTSDYCQFHQNCTAHTIEGFTNGAVHGVTMSSCVNEAAAAPLATGSAAAPSVIAAVSHLKPFTSENDSAQHESIVPASPVDLTDSTIATAQMHFASLNLSANATSVPAPILILEFSGDSADAPTAEDASGNWLSLIKKVKKSMHKHDLYPLPICARGLSIHGNVESSDSSSQHPVHISLTSEGGIYQQHMQLWSRSCVTPVGDFSSIVTKALAAANVHSSCTSCDFSISFTQVEHRDSCLRIMRHMISAFEKAEQKVTTQLSLIESESSAPAADGPSQLLLTLLSPTNSPVLDVLDFPYDGPSPPILQQLVCTIRTLYNHEPGVMLQKVHQDVPSRRKSGMRVIFGRPLHLLIQSCWGKDVRSRAVYWLISAVAAAAPAALRVKNCRTDDDGNDTHDEDSTQECTLLQTLIFSKKNVSSSISRDHDFEIMTLKMLLRIDPSLASDPVSDLFGETVFSRVCSSLSDASCMFHRDAYDILHCLLQACPSLASQSIPSELNQLPLHLLCAGDPQPRELRLLLNVFPAAAKACDDHDRLPIHALVQSTTFPECVDLLISVAPDCMLHHNSQGHYPLHYVSSEDQSSVACGLKGRKLECLLAALIRGCHGHIVCDFAPGSCKIVLQQLKKWAVDGISCEHHELVRGMSILDIGGNDSLEGNTIVELLLPLLPQCSSLTVLDISDNHLSRENVEALLPAILQLPKLHHLNLDGCNTLPHALKPITTNQHINFSN